MRVHACVVDAQSASRPRAAVERVLRPGTNHPVQAQDEGPQHSCPGWGASTLMPWMRGLNTHAQDGGPQHSCPGWVASTLMPRMGGLNTHAQPRCPPAQAPPHSTADCCPPTPPPSTHRFELDAGAVCVCANHVEAIACRACRAHGHVCVPKLHAGSAPNRGCSSRDQQS